MRIKKELTITSITGINYEVKINREMFLSEDAYDNNRSYDRGIRYKSRLIDKLNIDIYYNGNEVGRILTDKPHAFTEILTEICSKITPVLEKVNVEILTDNEDILTCECCGRSTF